MKKFLAILVSFYLALVLLMPKVHLYYALKNLLKPEHVVLVQEDVKDRWFDLKITGLRIYYDGIESAEAEEAHIVPWLFFNRLSITDLRAGKDLKKMFDFKADTVTLTHSVIDPMHVKLKADGNFGRISGSIDLKAGQVKLLCEPTDSFKRSDAFRELFRKREEGYVYESKLY
jgi:hypothetical protein